MKKYAVLFVAASLLVLFLAAPGYTWQGRMAGMGDVYGLVEDESDFLTHPAVIAKGKGVNYYGDFRYTYDKTTDWQYNSSGMAPSWGYFYYPYDISGHADTYEGRLGLAFPAGTGRIGIFFEYLGERSNFDGDQTSVTFTSNLDYSTYDMKNDLDNFALRFIYGAPLGNIKAGGEIQIAHKTEKTEEYSFHSDGDWYQNNLWSGSRPYSNLYPFMVPYDSRYWEVLGKLSFEGVAGDVQYILTIKGGAPFSSDNSYDYVNRYSGGDYIEAINMDGDVEGWNLGGDLWVRFPLRDNLTLPIVLRGGYRDTTRDGNGIGADIYVPQLSYSFTPFDYEHQTKEGFIEFGGGFDYTPCKGAKVAGGLYYTYSDFAQNLTTTFNGFVPMNYADFPETTEHRITFKAVAEREFSPVFALRGGFNAFYGWVESKYDYEYVFGIADKLDASGDGYRWGLGASVGASFKAGTVSIEPFINGGYSKLDIDGDVYRNMVGYPFQGDTNYKKTNWFIGGGFSIRF